MRRQQGGRRRLAGRGCGGGDALAACTVDGSHRDDRCLRVAVAATPAATQDDDRGASSPSVGGRPASRRWRASSRSGGTAATVRGGNSVHDARNGQCVHGHFRSSAQAHFSRTSHDAHAPGTYNPAPPSRIVAGEEE